MNLDIASGFRFGDAQGLKAFMLDHRFVHQQQSEAIAAQFNVTIGTFGLASDAAETEWQHLMDNGRQGGSIPPALRDWLKYHADMHNSYYLTLTSTNAPDLSVVDFSSPQQFSDWMFAHMEMHDFEQTQLGLS